MYLLKLDDSLLLLSSFRHSHSTMYLLKRRLTRNIEYLLHDSHSTMYLLKPDRLLLMKIKRTYSHSTMYLLKPFPVDYDGLVLRDSHSTMYLLKRGQRFEIRFTEIQFTFHHVSIKTTNC